MSWTAFPYFALTSLALWAAGACFAWKQKFRAGTVFATAGTVLYFSFILMMWIVLQRPPMRTMGETRVWYVFFISLAGILVYLRWKYRWILSFSLVMEAVFTCINLLKPEIHTKNLMPALQSPWFAPHVISYMFAYAMFGACTVMAVYLLWIKKTPIERREMKICDDMAKVGLAFMTIGMLLGAVWASQAWGSCWSWDPKETWAAGTWFTYLTYLHLRSHTKIDDTKKIQICLFILLFGFLFLQVCWYGINFLPSAQGSSVHVY